MKLTKQDIINLCSDFKNKLPNSHLAKKYKLSRSAIEQMKNRYFLHGITNLFHKHTNRTYSIELKTNICKRIPNGETKRSLA